MGGRSAPEEERKRRNQTRGGGQGPHLHEQDLVSSKDDQGHRGTGVGSGSAPPKKEQVLEILPVLFLAGFLAARLYTCSPGRGRQG